MEMVITASIHTGTFITIIYLPIPGTQSQPQLKISPEPISQLQLWLLIVAETWHSTEMEIYGYWSEIVQQINMDFMKWFLLFQILMLEPLQLSKLLQPVRH